MLQMIGSFITEQILGMKWLNEFVGRLLSGLGLDINSRVGSSIHFFLYDVIKIAVLLCVLIFLISYIQSYFPPEKSKKIMGRFHGIEANCIAALLGTVTPFCSCSSIPLFIGFTSAGLPLGVTFSFLISSPMVDLGSIILLTSIFGVKVAVIYVVFGLVIAVLGGTLIEKFHMENQVEEFIRKANAVDIDSPSLTQKERIVYSKDQMLETFKKVFPYVLIGVGIGAIVHNWIPEDFIEGILGSNNPFGVVLATILGIPIYADIFATIPIAEALLFKGATLGTVLAFMMGVTTLSLPSLIMLKKAIKMKLLLMFIAICTAGIIIVSYIFNTIGVLIL
ncbi:MAG: permease [Lachnospiraceae bacterium]|nr:permease [Lachnospiraceae bacterium]